ncbi:MAG: helix-turn-helix transcriptional regulator [Polyangiaceae bacterium]
MPTPKLEILDYQGPPERQAAFEARVRRGHMIHLACELAREDERRAARRERPPRPDGFLLSAAEVAAKLGVSLTTFKESIRADLPRVQIEGCRCVRYDRRDVEAWVSSHKAGGSDCRLVTTRTVSGSATLAAASRSPRVEEIRRKLLSKPRASTAR